MTLGDTDLIQLPGLKMHYAHAGNGENTVLFVHGYSASWRIWRKVMEKQLRAFPDDRVH